MQSLNAIAELAFRRVNPGDICRAPHTLEEYIETAKQKYAYLQWKFYFDGRQDPDVMFSDLLLKTKQLKVETDENKKLFAQLQDTPLDLPNDAGVFIIQSVIPSFCSFVITK